MDKWKDLRIKFLQEQHTLHIKKYETVHHSIQFDTQKKVENSVLDETFDNTFDLHNKTLRATQVLQRWARKRKAPVVQKFILKNIKQENHAATLIQKSFRERLQKSKISQVKKRPSYKNLVKVFTLDDVAHYVMIKLDKGFDIRPLKGKQNQRINIDLSGTHSKIVNFNEIQQMYIPQLIDIAKNLQNQIKNGQILTLKDLIPLIYFINNRYHVFGVTDLYYDLETEANDKQQVKDAQYDDQNIILIQSHIRAHLARTDSKILCRKLTKSSKFTAKVGSDYYRVSFLDESNFQTLNFRTRQITAPFTINLYLLQIYRPINSRNFHELISITNDVVSYTDEGIYLLDIRVKPPPNPYYLNKAAVTLQRGFKSKQLRDLINLKCQAKRHRPKGMLKQSHRCTTYNCQQIIYTAQLFKTEIKVSAHSRGLEIRSMTQRLFKPILDNEVLRIMRALLEYAEILVEKRKLYINTLSIEEIQSQIRSQKSTYEPTFHGRQYLNQHILYPSYLSNDINIDLPVMPKEELIGAFSILNSWRKIKHNKQNQLFQQKQVSDIQTYVNRFPCYFIQVDPIFDQEMIDYKRRLKAALKIQKAWRKAQMLKKIKFEQSIQKEVREPEPKDYFEMMINNTNNCLSPEQVLEDMRIPFIKLNDSETFSLYVVLENYDLLVVNQKKIYRIQHRLYQTHYIDKVLQSTSEQIRKLFRNPIKYLLNELELQSFQECVPNFIFNLRNQFTIALQRTIKLQLAVKRLREKVSPTVILLRMYVTRKFIEVKYFYKFSDQSILVTVKKNKKTCKYTFELFQLQQLYGKTHNGYHLHEHLFLKTITLEINVNPLVLKKLLQPLIRCLHDYITLDDLKISYAPYQIDITDLTSEPVEKISYLTTESYLHMVQIIINIQMRWRAFHNRQIYQLKLKKELQVQSRIIHKNGKLVVRTYVKRKDLDENCTSNEYLKMRIYRSDTNNLAIFRVEIGQLFASFRYDTTTTIIHNVQNDLLKSLQIKDNVIMRKETFNETLQLKEQAKILQLLLQKPSKPKICYYSSRDYKNGTSFSYKAVHTGAVPIESEADIQIDVNLKEFRTEYPQLDYNHPDIMPKICEQLIEKIRIDKNQVLSKMQLRPRAVSLRSESKVSLTEKAEIIQMTAMESQVLLRYFQIYRKIRYLVIISLDYIPISQGASPRGQFLSYLNVKAQRIGQREAIIWQMSIQQATQLTGAILASKQAQIIKQNILVLEGRFIYLTQQLCEHFANVSVLRYRILHLLQRLAKNRKFRQNRQQFEQEIAQYQRDNNFLSSVKYFGLSSLNSTMHFQVLIVKRKHYDLIAWDIKTYLRYQQTLSKLVDISEMHWRDGKVNFK